MILNSIQGILFLSYFTNYNIGEIYKALAYPGIDEYINAEGERLHSNWTDTLSIDKKIRECIKESSIAQERNRYNKIYHLPIISDKYPALLKQISQPPPMLYIKGRFTASKNVAIVGTRNVSIDAQNFTNDIVDKFLAADYAIVSGLAQGIDAIAHRRALEKNRYTIAILSQSLDSIYPKEHYYLANKILDTDGALVSEIPIGLNRGKKSFIERNRIQSGISEFVVPVEMSIKSGTMHTVNFAKTQKRKLILLTPPDDLKTTAQYEGISHLIDIQKKQRSPNVFVLDRDFKLADLPLDNTTRNLTLFD